MPTSIDDLFVHNPPGRPRWSVNARLFHQVCGPAKAQVHVGRVLDSRVPANQITGWSLVRCSCTATWPTWWCQRIERCRPPSSTRWISLQGGTPDGGGPLRLRRVLAALEGIRVGLADNWIRHVTDVRDRHRDLIASVEPQWRHDVLCELNAIEQVVNIAQTTVMLDAWGRGQKVTLHGWCYGLEGRAHQQPCT